MADELLDQERRPRPHAGGGGELVAWLAAGVLLSVVAAGAWAYHRAVTHGRQADLAAAQARAQAVLAGAVAREAATARGAPRSQASGDVREQIVDDSAGRLLWAAPVAGSPISLAYMPPGAQGFLFVRPRELADHPEGEKVFAALGPWGERAADRLQAMAGLTWRDVETLLVAATTNSAGNVEMCARLELTKVHPKEEIDGMIARGQRREHAGQDYFVDHETATFTVGTNVNGGASWLIVCPEHRAPELIDSAGEPPLVARDLETLLAHSDADRTATVIVSSGFLAAGAARVVSSTADPLRNALAALAGRDATAIALSAHWGDRFFLELAAAPALTVSPTWLATTLEQRFATDVDDIEQLIHDSQWPPFGRAILERFPEMLRKLAAMTRHGESDKLAVLRAYLPAVAGHNLLMATELLLSQSAAAPAAD